MSKDGGSKGGIGFFGLLTLLFIGLKLGKVIHWSWWWVLSPMWVPVSAALAVLAVCYVALWAMDEDN